VPRVRVAIPLALWYWLHPRLHRNNHCKEFLTFCHFNVHVSNQSTRDTALHASRSTDSPSYKLKFKHGVKWLSKKALKKVGQWQSVDLRKNCMVILLHGTQLHADDELALGWNVLKDVGFETAQQMTTKQLMKSLDLLLFRDVGKLFQKHLQVAVIATHQQHFSTYTTAYRYRHFTDILAAKGRITW